MTKQCAGCKQELDCNCFHRNKHAKDGLCRLCKDCTREYQKSWRSENSLDISKRRKDRPESKKEKDRVRTRRWAADHPEEKRALDAFYRETHKEEKTARHNRRMETDIQYRLACSLRWRMNRAIRASSKSGSAVNDLGCSITELRNHLESQFQSGMTWENWGREPGCWHIDHKIPLISFDLEDRSQFLRACNFTNLQPLWREENIRKGGSLVH